MKPICLIPARAGSKGLKNKNMLFLDGKPMIFHTIEAALESGCFDKEDIYVSTDSTLYKEICETKGIKVLLRPEALATDFTTSYDVNEHFLKDFPDEQVFVLLQVTSPLRNGKNIKEALALYDKGIAENVVSFSKVEKSPRFFTELYENNFAKDICGVDKGYRRQNDKKELYAPNGAIYITNKKTYLKNKSYFTPKTQAYIMKKEDSIDVDDRLDFTSVIGRIFFDYKRREKKNIAFYEGKYRQFLENTSNKALILGDSRLVGFQKQGYDNFSIGGVTLATIYQNKDLIFKNYFKEVVIAAGVNDLISSYPLEIIKENISNLLNYCQHHQIKTSVVEIPYTLFRDSVNNEDIKILNNYLKEATENRNFTYIETNDILSKDEHLVYEYTSDGLHFNPKGEQIYFERVDSKL